MSSGTRSSATRTAKDVGLPRAPMRRVEKVLDARRRPSSFVDRLPFIGPAGEKRRKDQLPRDFWHNVKSTGDHLKDSEIGSAYAYLALQAIKADRFQPLLGWIVLDMIEHKCPKHIVVGFFQTIADVALGLHQIPAAHVRLASSQ
jgi:hypothetical protein